jgi:hypothetical protein
MYSIGIPALDSSETNCAAALAVSTFLRCFLVHPGVNQRDAAERTFRKPTADRPRS